jgi:hypothetical protein
MWCLAILFRCCDILTRASAESGQYGFVNWNVYLLTIPVTARTIYILMEPLDYVGCDHGEHCRQISEAMAGFLSTHYPDAVVAIRRGHPDIGLVQLAETKVIVCTASSFCIFPAYMNSGKIFMQLSKLFANNEAVRISNNFHWITYPSQIYFNLYDPYDSQFVVKIINRLTSLSA